MTTATANPSAGYNPYLRPDYEPGGIHLAQLPGNSSTIAAPPTSPSLMPPPPGYPGYPGQPAYPAYPDPYGGYPGQPFDVTLTRRVQAVSGTYTWLAGGSSANELGVNVFDINASFAFGFLYSDQPLVITPGFTWNLWHGANALALPSKTYDAYVDISWRPQFGPTFGMDLGFTPSMSTDFQDDNSDMFRWQARALGTVRLNPTMELVAGVLYLDRRKFNLLPAGGLIWTPNTDTRFELFFPRPRLAQRLPTVGTTDWWWYVAGEFGGGEWSIVQDTGVRNKMDYFDLRAVLGLEWQTYQGPRGMFEVGWVFDREITLNAGVKTTPDDTFMLRAGVFF